jgi:hypothetical protein
MAVQERVVVFAAIGKADLVYCNMLKLKANIFFKILYFYFVY